MTRTPRCAFCDIAADWKSDYGVITPLAPMVDGHVMFVPRVHVKDFATDPQVASTLMFLATSFARDTGLRHFNLIANNGGLAGQTVHHAHLHLIPREALDDVVMPWEVEAHVLRIVAGTGRTG